MRNNIYNPFFNSTYNNIAASKLFSPTPYPFQAKPVAGIVQGYSPFYSNIYGIINYPLRGYEPCYRKEEEKILNSMALDSYIYGYPLVTTMIARYMPGAIINKVYIDKNNTDKTKVKSDIILDLTNGPVILRIPEYKGGEYTVELMNAWTDIFADLSTKTTGNNKKEILIVGPDFKKPLPDDIDIIGSPTNTALIATRVMVKDTQNDSQEKNFLNKFELVPLYQQDINYQTKEDIVEKYIRALDMGNNQRPVDIVNKLNTEQFFKIMVLGSNANPPRQKDVEMNRKLAVLGILPADSFDYKSLKQDVQQALEFANRNGVNAIENQAIDVTESDEQYYLKRARNSMKIFG